MAIDSGGGPRTPGSNACHGGVFLRRVELLVVARPRLPTRTVFAVPLLDARALRSPLLFLPIQLGSISARTISARDADLRVLQILLPGDGTDRFIAVCESGGVLWEAGFAEVKCVVVGERWMVVSG